MSNRIGSRFGGGRKKRKKIIAGVALLLFIPYIGSTLAATVTINTDKALEFGQGALSAIACDTDIRTAISETWYNSGPYFRVSTIALTNLNNTDNTASPSQNSGCGNKKLKIQLLDSSGDPLTIGTSEAKSVIIKVPTSNTLSISNEQNNTVLNGNTAELSNSGATSTLTIRIPSSTPVNAGDLSRIVIESED